MASGTDKRLRQDVIYSVFVRNFSEEGNFKSVAEALPRIKDLGVDILWLMPIHPIGEKNRKGTWGSPYAIRDYRDITPDYGTMKDLKALVKEAHKLGLKVIIDVVYNHTSPDSVLVSEHPEWFYHRKDGSLGNRVGEWWDVVDLDYSYRKLWDYQIETLKMWAEVVDGFRCDVASMVPLSFWQKARQEVEAVRPGCLWLAESIHQDFILENRRRGIACSSDSEIFQAFDMSYEYDTFPLMEGAISGRNSLESYVAALNAQEMTFPDNYVKVRFLENHDQIRAHARVESEAALHNWTAFLYFQKGAVMLYAGQEALCRHMPELFEKDVVNWEGLEGSPFPGWVKPLYRLKKDAIFADSTFKARVLPGDVLMAEHTENAKGPNDDAPKRRLAGFFSLTGEARFVDVSAFGIADGRYDNLATDGETIEVAKGHLNTRGVPVILDAARIRM